MRLLQERTAVKILVEKNGVLLSFTTKKRAYFLFITRAFFGMKVAPTTDPDLGIVELSGYDILAILANWDRMANIRVHRPGT